MKENWLLALLVLAVLADSDFKSDQNPRLTSGGELAAIVVPGAYYAAVRQYPFGLGALLHGGGRAAPNWFFAPQHAGLFPPRATAALSRSMK